jgi:hypothetical protein
MFIQFYHTERKLVHLIKAPRCQNFRLVDFPGDKSRAKSPIITGQSVVSLMSSAIGRKLRIASYDHMKPPEDLEGYIQSSRWYLQIVWQL